MKVGLTVVANRDLISGSMYSHLSNKRGAWNKRGGVPKMENHQMWRG